MLLRVCWWWEKRVKVKKLFLFFFPFLLTSRNVPQFFFATKRTHSGEETTGTSKFSPFLFQSNRPVRWGKQEEPRRRGSEGNQLLFKMLPKIPIPIPLLGFALFFPLILFSDLGFSCLKEGMMGSLWSFVSFCMRTRLAHPCPECVFHLWALMCFWTCSVNFSFGFLCFCAFARNDWWAWSLHNLCHLWFEVP